MNNELDKSKQTSAEQPTDEPSAPMTDMGGSKSETPKPHKNMMIWMAVALVIITVGAVWFLMKKDKEPEVVKAKVKVGVMLPLSGGLGSTGSQELDAILLAKKQLGADNIELVQEDSQCDATAAEAAIKRLVEKQVIAIIGETCSGASLGALPFANENKIVMISPAASSPSLSIEDDYFFRVVPPDELQGEFAAKLLYDKGIKSVAILHSNETYGNGLGAVFKERFEALGGKIVANIAAEREVISLDTQVTEIKASNPEAIYFAINSSPTAITALKSIRAAGLTVPIYSGDGGSDPAIITGAGDAAEGFIVTAFASGTKAFKQAMADEYPTEELTFHSAEAGAYDAFHAIDLAVKKGATTGQKMKDILPTIMFDGVSTRVEFDKYGQIDDYTYDLLEVKGGKFTDVEQ